MGDWGAHIVVTGSGTDSVLVKWSCGPFFTACSPGAILDKVREYTKEALPPQEAVARADFIEYIDSQNKVAVFTDNSFVGQRQKNTEVFLLPFLRHSWRYWRIHQMAVNYAVEELSGVEQEVKSISSGDWASWSVKRPRIGDGDASALQYVKPATSKDFREGLLLVRICSHTSGTPRMYLMPRGHLKSILFSRHNIIDSFFSHSSLKSTELYEFESDYALELSASIEVILGIDLPSKSLVYADLLPPLHEAHIKRYWPGWKIETADMRRYGRAIGLTRGPCATKAALHDTLNQFLSGKEGECPGLRGVLESYLEETES